ITVWLASLGVNYTAVRLWKEVLLIALSAGVVALIIRDGILRKRLRERVVLRRIVYLVGAYVLLHVLAGVVALLRGEVNLPAFGYAFISNLRFLIFFLVTVVAGACFGTWLKRYWRRLLLWPAMAVI